MTSEARVLLSRFVPNPRAAERRPGGMLAVKCVFTACYIIAPLSRFDSLWLDEIAKDTGIVGSNVEITLEIHAELPEVGSEKLVRDLTENSRTLRFSNSGFEGQ